MKAKQGSKVEAEIQMALVLNSVGEQQIDDGQDKQNGQKSPPHQNVFGGLLRYATVGKDHRLEVVAALSFQTNIDVVRCCIRQIKRNNKMGMVDWSAVLFAGVTKREAAVRGHCISRCRLLNIHGNFIQHGWTNPQVVIMRRIRLPRDREMQPTGIMGIAAVGKTRQKGKTGVGIIDNIVQSQ